MKAKVYKVDPVLLQKCVLWPGSMLQLDDQYGGITVERLEATAASLEKADDRTKNEDEWLRAINATAKLARAANWAAETHDEFMEQAQKAQDTLEKSGYTGSVLAGPIGETKKEK